MTVEGSVAEGRKIRELEERYRNELMDPDERAELWDRIVRLKRRADTLDAQWSCLELMPPE